MEQKDEKIITKKPQTVVWPPDYILKTNVKKSITTNPALQGAIMQRFNISPRTVYNWLDGPMSLNYTFLILVWDFLSENEPNVFSSINDLITIKKQED